MNKNRIVVIRNPESPNTDPWKDGASDLFNTDLLRGSGLNSSDLVIPEEVELMLASDEYNINISNSTTEPFKDLYGKLVGNTAGKYATGAASVVGSTISGGNVRFNPWFKNMKTWEETSVNVTALRFEFALGQFGLWNAKKEVFAPMLSLLALTLPREQNRLMARGPFLATSSLISNYIQQSTGLLKDFVVGDNDSQLNNISDALGEVLNSKGSGYYHVSIGETFTFQYCIFSAANVSFSTEVDGDGYPIKGTITLNLEGTVPSAISTDSGLPYALRFGSGGFGGNGFGGGGGGAW